MLSYPRELDFDKQIVVNLAEDLRSGGRALESKVFKFRDSWRIVVVLPEPKSDTYTFALLDVRELFMDVLSNIPDQMNVTITYLEEQIVSQGEKNGNSPGQTVKEELQQLVFPFLGWPGWCVTISPAARFDERHALSGVFRAPVMLLITLSALGWAWGINERAKRGKKLVEDIRESAVSLQLEHSRWAQALESVEGAIVLCDTNEKIEYCNAAAKVLFSAIADRKVAFISDAFSPESAALIRTTALPNARSGEAWQGNVFLGLKEKNGRPLPLKVVAALNSKEGLIGYSLFFGVNTPQSEGAHFHSTNPAYTTAIYSVLDGLEVPIWLAASDGNMEFANRKLLDFLGCSQEHFRHAWPLEFCHRDDVTGFVAAGARLGTQRRRVQNSTGYMKWFSESISAVRTVEGSVGRYVGVLVECGKERRLEEVARCLRQELDALMTARTTVMWIHDLTKQKVTTVSSGFDNLWGISVDELMLRANAWQELTQPPVRLPDVIQDRGLELEYSIIRDDGASIPVTHTIIPTEWSDGVDSDNHLVHIVERRGVTGRDTSTPSVRELKNELEYLYSFLAQNVHDAADQVGRLGRALSQQAKQLGDSTISGEAMQLQFESERLLAWVSEYGEVAKILNQDALKPGVSIIEALESLSRNKAVIPQRISFSGDLGVKLPLALESLEIAMRSLAIFASDRGPKKVPIDIKVLVRKTEKGIGIEASLGELSMDKEKLTKVFLPGGMNSEKGRITPSLAPLNAMARKYNGRAWLSTNTSGRVTLHLQLNGNFPSPS
jgi:PAS domain-containing protein